MMINITFVFGTRPEFIKLAKVIEKLKNNRKFSITIISSGQQDDLLKAFKDSKLNSINLKIKKFNNTEMFISNFLVAFDMILKKKKVDYLFVQGDTSTVYASSLYGFLNKIPIIHLEAGLRTNDIHKPFPEEFYRQNVSKIASIHLAQTNSGKRNLIKEGIKSNKIFVVGNPGIDYLLDGYTTKISKKLESKNNILITMHRREAIDGSLRKFIYNLKVFLRTNPEYSVNWPVHSNPNILNQIKESFKSKPKEKLKINFLKPLDYFEFNKYLSKAEYLITDSGGVQEEGAYLGKKLLIARDVTEREDIIRLKLGMLIKADGSKLFDRIQYYKKNSIDLKNTNIWRNYQGRGKSSLKINNLLTKILC